MVKEPWKTLEKGQWVLFAQGFKLNDDERHEKSLSAATLGMIIFNTHGSTWADGCDIYRFDTD